MSTQKVLIVEDENDIREWIQETLEDWGHLTVGVDKGKLAYDIAKLNNFDSILIDIGLPVMNGIELLKELKSNLTQEANFVCITGYSDFLGEDIEESGFDSVLNKPFSEEELNSALR